MNEVEKCIRERRSTPRFKRVPVARELVEQRKAEDDAQKITDKAIKDIDGICAAKEKEIMEV